MGIILLCRIVVVNADDRRDGGEVVPGGKVGAVLGVAVFVVCAVPGGAVIVPSHCGRHRRRIVQGPHRRDRECRCICRSSSRVLPQIGEHLPLAHGPVPVQSR